MVRQLDADLQAEFDLPLDWYDVLVQLQEAGGRRTMGNLANAMLISPSNCSRLVDRMSSEGFVRRETDDVDGRVKHAVLTDAGFAALNQAAPTHLAGVERYFAGHLGDDGPAFARMYNDVLIALEGNDNNQVEGGTDAPGRGGGTSRRFGASTSDRGDAPGG